MSALKQAAVFQIASLASLIKQVAAQIVYYQTRPGFCSNRVCFSRWNGYYCCSGLWYGSGWAIFLYVFFVLLIFSCLIWCCVAANEPTRTIYVRPKTSIMTVETNPSTQPGPVTGTVGDSQKVNGGSYLVHADDDPVQGQPMPHQPDPDTGPPIRGIVYPDVLPPPQSPVQMV